MVEKKKLFAGVYATSPSLKQWKPEMEHLYFNEIRKMLPDLAGLELPFWGEGLHPYDDQFLLNHIDLSWDYMLTCVPASMKLMELSPHIGLSSENENGRKAAVESCRRAWVAIQKLQDFVGRPCVRSIQLSSSPTPLKGGAKSSTTALEKSLTEILQLNWGQTIVCLEHCDSFTGVSPIKGFLNLDDELLLLQMMGGVKSNLGMILNWGRSVIEGQSVEAPIQHLKTVRKHNLLRGLMFSGVCVHEEGHQENWTDLHAPLARGEGIMFGCQDSLMTSAEVERSLMTAKLGAEDLLGFKLSALPIDTASLQQRVGVNLDMYRLLSKLTS